MVLSLGRLELSILTTQSDSEALQLVQDHSPQLIVVDLFLPRGNAIDLLGKIRKFKQPASTKIIVISSFGYKEVVSKAIKAGANDFMVKPFDADELLSRAKQLLNS